MSLSLEAGCGRIVLGTDGGLSSVFSELSATYPLKLISPRTTSNNLSIVYMLSYGGGLVGGDCLRLDVDVRDGASLLLLSQGSTKVFKTRPGQRLSTQRSDAITEQRMNIHVAPRSSLFLLPDPVTCFRDAKYHQLQSFHISADSSIAILDWITSGRKSLGEEWVFSRFYSLSELWVDGERIVKDAMLLEERDDPPGFTTRTLAESLAPYSCYATLIMHGELVQDAMRLLSAAYNEITVFKQASPPSLLWSYSTIRGGKGCVVRVTAKESEAVKLWLGQALRGLETVLGTDVYRRAFT